MDVADGPAGTSASWAVLQQCAFYGLVTCLTTGLGVLPLHFFSVKETSWLGIGNAIAAGMMMAASADMAFEGMTTNIGAWQSTFGMVVGAAFVLVSKHLLQAYQEEDVTVLHRTGLMSRKGLLVVAVMTVHSVAEGIAIGVSFSTAAPPHLGLLIAASLAIHNIPEGFAVAMSLVPQGCSLRKAALWGIFTSSPQPAFALLACMFVNQFEVLLPVGLGFAAGAMLYVALVELFLEEALEHCCKTTAACTTAFAAACMHSIYVWLSAGAH